MDLFYSAISILLSLAISPPPVAPLAVSEIAMEIEVSSRHSRNTERAEEFNQRTWNSGFADVYTISATFELYGERQTALMDVICAPKIETKARDIKGGPYVWDNIRNFNRNGLVIPVSDDYRIVYRSAFSCKGLVNERLKNGFPFTASAYQTANVQHIAEPITNCSVGLDEGAVQIGGLNLRPIEVLSVRQELVSAVLSREDYGVADRAVAYEQGHREPFESEIFIRNAAFYSWRQSSACWGGRRYECWPEAVLYCMPD